jgi:hypothetical protein
VCLSNQHSKFGFSLSVEAPCRLDVGVVAAIEVGQFLPIALWLVTLQRSLAAARNSTRGRPPHLGSINPIFEMER